jgi:hypothetical protein
MRTRSDVILLVVVLGLAALLQCISGNSDCETDDGAGGDVPSDDASDDASVDVPDDACTIHGCSRGQVIGVVDGVCACVCDEGECTDDQQCHCGGCPFGRCEVDGGYPDFVEPPDDSEEDAAEPGDVPDAEPDDVTPVDAWLDVEEEDAASDLADVSDAFDAEDDAPIGPGEACDSSSSPGCEAGLLCVQTAPYYCYPVFIGTCEPVPADCSTEPDAPLCACDGTRYGNECEARRAGVGTILSRCA